MSAESIYIQRPTTLWVITNDVNTYQKSRAILQDALIVLGNPNTAGIHPIQKARLITFHDDSTGKYLMFITNDFTFAASTIAGIYKRHWQVESLSKRIKQNFELHSFLGDNKNAIRIQLWCTFIADLLIKIVKDQVERKRNGHGKHLKPGSPALWYLYKPVRVPLQSGKSAYKMSTPT